MKRALITGASGGIGAELAKECAGHGIQTILVARSEDKLQKLAHDLPGEHEVIACDLAQPNSAETLWDQVAGDVDILINNAGFATYGPFVEQDAQAELSEMTLNMITLTQLTRLALPPMMQRREGRVLNVASTAALVPGPLMATYYATKHYVLAHSQAVDYEVRESGVRVCCLCPGATESDFQSRADMESSKLVQGSLQSSEEVARIGFEGMMEGRRVIFCNTRDRMMAALSKLAPAEALLKSVYEVQKPKD